MSFHKLLPLLGIVFSAALWSPDNCLAETVTLNAVADTYIRFGSSTIRNTNFNNDGNGLITGPAGYAPLVQFDLSSVAGKTITNAYIRGYLFADKDGDYNSPLYNFEQEMYLVVPNDENDPTFNGGLVPVEGVITWNGYANSLNAGNGATEELMGTLGDYAATGPSTPNVYHDFAAASAADLVLLNGRVTTTNPAQRYAFFFVDGGLDDGYRWWGDKETIYNDTPEFPNASAHPMQLVLEVEDVVVPEPSSTAIALMGGLVGLGYRVRRRNIRPAKLAGWLTYMARMTNIRLGA